MTGINALTDLHLPYRPLHHPPLVLFPPALVRSILVTLGWSCDTSKVKLLFSICPRRTMLDPEDRQGRNGGSASRKATVEQGRGLGAGAGNGRRESISAPTKSFSSSSVRRDIAATVGGGGFATDRFGRRIPKTSPTPAENARKLEELRDGWNHRPTPGRASSGRSGAEWARRVGWDDVLVSGMGAGAGRGAGDGAIYSGGPHGADLPAHAAQPYAHNGHAFLRTDCRAEWRKVARGGGEGTHAHRPKLDVSFGDDFAELVGASATRSSWLSGSLADLAGSRHRPNEANVSTALGHTAWREHPQHDHLTAARRVEAAKFSAASMAGAWCAEKGGRKSHYTSDLCHGVHRVNQ